MHRSPLSTFLLVLLALLAACSRPAPRLQGTLERTEAWPADFVTAFGALPLQHEGRVMPFSTLAASTLYAVHGRRDVQFVTPDGTGVDRTVKLNPTEWLLDVWCFPEQAARYPLFRIENVGVLSALGFVNEGQKQGFEYLPYDQLVQQGEKLQELNDQYEGKYGSVELHDKSVVRFAPSEDDPKQTVLKSRRISSLSSFRPAPK